MAILNTDENRFLIKVASKEKITGKWKDVVEEVVESYKKHLDSNLVSIYIGGSAATGNAVEIISDVDTYAIVDLEKDEMDKSWIELEKKRIDFLFPFQRGVEISIKPLKSLDEYKKFQIKLLSVCVYGKDLGPKISDYKLNKQTLAKIRVNATKDIQSAKKKLGKIDDPEEIRKVGIWIYKRMLRSTGMLVLWKESFFTMELDILVKLVIRHYPEKSTDVKRLLRHTKKGSESKKEILDLLNTFGKWLIREDEKVFGKYSSK